MLLPLVLLLPFSAVTWSPPAYQVVYITGGKDAFATADGAMSILHFSWCCCSRASAACTGLTVVHKDVFKVQQPHAGCEEPGQG
jgi:hypothetical protein